MTRQWRTCTAEGCIKPSRTSGGAYCEMHYYRLRRTGTTEQLRPWSRHEGICKVDDCENPVDDRWGMCTMHATRVTRHGDPLAVIDPKDRDMPRGEHHPSWTGSDATYGAAHRRVKAQRGPASAHPCADCGAHARHWSYDHSDPGERISDGGHAYSLDVDRYIPRCVSCHKKNDCATLRQKGRIGAAPRCGKPMRIRKDNYPASEPGAVPVCGLPEGHVGPCRSVESYKRSLARERGAA